MCTSFVIVNRPFAVWCRNGSSSRNTQQALSNSKCAAQLSSARAGDAAAGVFSFPEGRWSWSWVGGGCCVLHGTACIADCQLLTRCSLPPRDSAFKSEGIRRRFRLWLGSRTQVKPLVSRRNTCSEYPGVHGVASQLSHGVARGVGTRHPPGR
jgi:hypothetical protein